MVGEAFLTYFVVRYRDPNRFIGSGTLRNFAAGTLLQHLPGPKTAGISGVFGPGEHLIAHRDLGKCICGGSSHVDARGPRVQRAVGS